ncbi:hypothetical protein FN846DRAFT_537708 [Sphaerosporella brunnea]|uniref:Uncharacterized protein n=1 Tax=Sphaerosporella brunnea TaxID=1250544 RepID=A0A5J5EEB6_9PEZI|nr:hypothetical protein FN846DRAFT_537708 [Sphaerosporella brunnea]
MRLVPSDVSVFRITSPRAADVALVYFIFFRLIFPFRCTVRLTDMSERPAGRDSLLLLSISFEAGIGRRPRRQVPRCVPAVEPSRWSSGFESHEIHDQDCNSFRATTAHPSSHAKRGPGKTLVTSAPKPKGSMSQEYTSCISGGRRQACIDAALHQASIAVAYLTHAPPHLSPKKQPTASVLSRRSEPWCDMLLSMQQLAEGARRVATAARRHPSWTHDGNDAGFPVHVK